MTKFVSGGDASGTSLQGYVMAKYADLVAVFGQPTDGPNADIDSKVTCEWVVTFGSGKNKVVATIYDWKTYDGTPADEYNWHIGGKSNLAVAYVTDVVREYQDMVCEQLSGE